MDLSLVKQYEADPSLEAFVRGGLIWVVAGVIIGNVVKNKDWSSRQKTLTRFFGASLVSLPFTLRKK